MYERSLFSFASELVMRKWMMKRKRVQAEVVRRVAVERWPQLSRFRDLAKQRRFGYLEELFVVEECNYGYSCVAGCEEALLQRWSGSEEEEYWTKRGVAIRHVHQCRYVAELGPTVLLKDVLASRQPELGWFVNSCFKPPRHWRNRPALHRLSVGGGRVT